jgi:uncharacterized protein YjeT (DUF2065 family)
MEMTLFLLSIVFIIAGVILMIRNKFYKTSTKTMLFPAEIKLFLSGLILVLMGVYIFISELLKVL